MPIWGDFTTARGNVQYSLAVDGLHEDYPTDSSPRTFYTVARVKADQVKAFREAMLPDVDEATSPPTGAGQTLLLDAWTSGTPTTTYQRRAFNRLLPEQHPEHQKAWCVRLTLLRGEGVAVKSDTFWMSFQQTIAGAQKPGYVTFGVTYQDMPYPLSLGNTTVMAGGRTVPSSDIDNAEVNSSAHSELERYCFVRPSSKTTSLQVRGNHFYWLNNDGTVLLSSPVNGSRRAGSGVMTPVAAENGAPTIPFGFTAFQVTWYMIPRLPRAVYSLRNCVNQSANIFFDPKIVPTSENPAVETLLYLGPDGPQRPYYTVTGKTVYDVTLNFLYRPDGHNSVFCPFVHDWRRVVAGPITGDIAFDTSAPPAGNPDLANLPSDTSVLVSGSNPGNRPYNLGDLLNIWKFNN